MQFSRFKNFIALGLLISSGLIISCQDEEKLTVADTLDISEDALSESYYQDMDDMGNLAVEAPSDSEFSGGRTKATTITISDDRFDCNDVTVTLESAEGSSFEIPSGTITIDFGTTGCADSKGNVRTGKIIIAYAGRRFQVGSVLIVTTENYYINGIKLEGTRTLTNVTGTTASNPKFNAILEDGKATFPDGKFATRESDITWALSREPFTTLTVLANSSASGTTRFGRTYEVTVLEDLKYERFCGIAVSGIKKYIINGSKEITIDYGDGTCDNKVVVTIDGTSRNLVVND